MAMSYDSLCWTLRLAITHCNKNIIYIGNAIVLSYRYSYIDPQVTTVCKQLC